MLALLILVPVASAAGADDDPETLIREGVALRRSGDDAKAFGYFNRAYEISRTPRAAAQLGLDEAVLNRNADAQRHLSEALSGNDPWVDQNRALLERTRETVRTRLGKIELRGLPSDATYGLANGSTEPVPADGVIWVEPGSVSLKLAAPRHATIAKDAVVTAGGAVAIDVSLPAAAAESPTPGTPTAAVTETNEEGKAPSSSGGFTQSTDADSRSGLRIAGVITASAGVVIGVVGLIVYLDGRSKLNGIESDAMAMPPRPYNPSNDNYQTLGNTGLGMLIGGVVAAGTGVGLYLFGRGGESTGGGAHVAVGYVPGLGGNLQIGGRF